MTAKATGVKAAAKKKVERAKAAKPGVKAAKAKAAAKKSARTPGTPNGGARRDQILDASRSLFSHYGYKKTTVDDIARAAGVTKPTIYAYFKNKEDILLSLIGREASHVLETGMKSAGGEASAPERLAAMFLSVDSLLDEDPFLQGIVNRDPDVLTPEVVRVAFDFEKRVMSAIASILKEGMEEGVFRKTDPEMMAYALVRLHEAFTFSAFEPLERDRDKANEFFIQTVMAALRP